MNKPSPAPGTLLTWHDPGGRVVHVLDRVEDGVAVFLCKQRLYLEEVVTPEEHGFYRPIHAGCASALETGDA